MEQNRGLKRMQRAPLADRAREWLSLMVDPSRRRLLAARPHPAASTTSDSSSAPSRIEVIRTF
jgi:hypothetical protein